MDAPNDKNPATRLMLRPDNVGALASYLESIPPRQRFSIREAVRMLMPKILELRKKGGLCRKVPKPPVTPSALSCNLSVSQEDTGMAHKAPGKSFREGISLVQIFRMFPIPQPKRRPE